MEDFKTILLDASELAKKNILKFRKSDISPDTKENTISSRSFVTKADTETEEALKRFLGKKLHGFSFLGEESGFEGEGESNLVVIDPLDCTKGFIDHKDNYGTFIGIYQYGFAIAGLDGIQLQVLII